MATLLKFNNILRKKNSRIFNFTNKEINFILRVKNFEKFGQLFKICETLYPQKPMPLKNVEKDRIALSSKSTPRRYKALHTFYILIGTHSRHTCQIEIDLLSLPVAIIIIIIIIIIVIVITINLFQDVQNY